MIRLEQGQTSSRPLPTPRGRGGSPRTPYNRQDVLTKLKKSLKRLRRLQPTKKGMGSPRPPTPPFRLFRI